MLTMSVRTLFRGTFIHSSSLARLEVLENAAVGVDEKGTIGFIAREGESIPSGWSDAKEVIAKTNQFFFPGFIGKTFS